MKTSLIRIIMMFLTLGISNSFAQDVITKRDGTKIQAKVTEVLQKEVKYKKFENLDGPTYTIKKSKITLIQYENGEKEVYEKFFTHGIFAKRCAYFEAGGAAGLFSGNFEISLFTVERITLNVRGGFGAIMADGFVWPSFPIMATSYINLKNNHHVDIGMGTTLDTYYDRFITATAGYRWQKPQKGLSFRANVNVLYEPLFQRLIVTPGVSLGYSF